MDMNNKTNILLITADDMNWDAVGAYGCPVNGTTPNIDKLAEEGIRFDHAHVTISVCQPSRSALMTGLYPHRSCGEGFYNLRKPEVPILPELLKNGGYTVGILGKVGHSTPYNSFQWDMHFDIDELGHGRNPSIYFEHATNFIEQAQQDNKPFFLMLNSHDPHRPFYGNDNPLWYDDECPASIPSKTFIPNEIKVPGFLEDLPDVRLEISEYYSSVRRCDDTIGATLNILKQLDCYENTLVIFLSDNGMAFPFSKTNCYLNSTKTPWIMRWPSYIKAGIKDQKHFISGIDMLPTILDVAGVPQQKNVDGTSFLPILRGEEQTNRELVFTQFHQTAAKSNYPMRCVQNKQFGYIFNPWADGKRNFKNESQAGRTMKAMQNASLEDNNIAERVDLFLHRTKEEFYDFENDPNARNNLFGNPEYADEITKLQKELETWMIKTGDKALTAFQNRDSKEALELFMKQQADELNGTI